MTTWPGRSSANSVDTGNLVLPHGLSMAGGDPARRRPHGLLRARCRRPVDIRRDRHPRPSPCCGRADGHRHHPPVHRGGARRRGDQHSKRSRTRAGLSDPGGVDGAGGGLSARRRTARPNPGRVAAILYDDGMSQWATADDEDTERRAGVDGGIIKTGLGIVRDLRHTLFVIGAALLGVIALLIAIGLTVAIRDWRMKLTVLGSITWPQRCHVSRRRSPSGSGSRRRRPRPTRSWTTCYGWASTACGCPSGITLR